MSHNHNLSINSLSSLIEPTTPPPFNKVLDKGQSSAGTIGSAHMQGNKKIGSKSVLWDSQNKLNNALNLPNFHIDQTDGPLMVARPGLVSSVTSGESANMYSVHSRQVSVDSSFDKENQEVVIPTAKKIDKDYLASINKVPLVQIKLEILKLLKDQYGCRFLQKKIDENIIANYQVRLANFEVIFKQIYPHMYELIIDPFGNYLIQKLIGYCTEANLDLILEILQYNLFQISINQHGTRALQKIIDNLNNAHQLQLLTQGLRPYIIELIKDLNGNHVIQKILNKYLPIQCQFIYDAIITDLYVVATHKHGCCVLQKCLNHVTPSQLAEFLRCILEFKNFSLLINDQFGNYVLQYLILINSLDINYKMFDNFVQYGVSKLCNLKFSSNVVEKFLKNCFNNETLNVNFSNLKFDLIYCILASDLNKLINDPYGNYVIQTLIDIVVNPQVSYERKPSVFGEPPSYTVEKLHLLLPLPATDSSVSIQIAIIKYWFQNCKIVSSFGKRIQSKINAILNNYQPVAPKKRHGHSMSANHPYFGYPSHQHSHSYGLMQEYQKKKSGRMNHIAPAHQNMDTMGPSFVPNMGGQSILTNPNVVNQNLINQVPVLNSNYIFTQQGPVSQDYVVNEAAYGIPQGAYGPLPHRNSSFGGIAENAIFKSQMPTAGIPAAFQQTPPSQFTPHFNQAQLRTPGSANSSFLSDFGMTPNFFQS